MKNENRSGYKKTKVGWIPEEWEMQHLRECSVKIGSGVTPRGGDSAYTDSGVPFLRSQNVLSGEYSSNGLKYIPAETHKKMKGSALQSDDILFNITGASIGRCCLFPAHLKEGNVNQHVCIVRLKKGHNAFLFMNTLNSVVAKKQLHENQAGGGREGLNFKNLGGFKIPVPSLAEQEAIAEVLECWDAGIRSMEKKIEVKLQLKKGLMQKLLSGQSRLSGFSNDWKTATLGNEASLITKGTTPTSIGKAFTDKGINFIKIESLTPEGKLLKHKTAFIDAETHKQLKRSQLCANDILISIAGALGRVAIVSNEIIPANTNQALAIVRLKEDSSLNLKYLFWSLNGDDIKTHIKSINVQAAQANLSLKDVSNFKISLPSIDEQQAIAEVLTDADTEIEKLEAKLARWKDQKKYLLNELVTGSIRTGAA